MDLSKEYVNAAIASRIVQELWDPAPYDMIMSKKNNEFYFLSWDDYKMIRKNPEKKTEVYFIPQEHNINKIVYFYYKPDFYEGDSEEETRLTLSVIDEIDNYIETEKKKYANFDLILKTEERKKLYYIYTYIEKKGFPGIVLFSNS